MERKAERTCRRHGPSQVETAHDRDEKGHAHGAEQGGGEVEAIGYGSEWNRQGHGIAEPESELVYDARHVFELYLSHTFEEARGRLLGVRSRRHCH